MIWEQDVKSSKKGRTEHERPGSDDAPPFFDRASLFSTLAMAATTLSHAISKNDKRKRRHNPVRELYDTPEIPDQSSGRSSTQEQEQLKYPLDISSLKRHYPFLLSEDTETFEAAL